MVRTMNPAKRVNDGCGHIDQGRELFKSGLAVIYSSPVGGTSPSTCISPPRLRPSMQLE
jgi:hypothetical protein